MTCPQFESRIPDLLDDQLPPADRLAMETHLASCPACSRLTADLQRLDSLLSRSIQPTGVSPGFRARLWRRIESEPGGMTEAARADCKRRMQAEFGTQLTRLRRGALHLGRWLDLAGTAASFGFIGAVLGTLARAVTGIPATPGSPGMGGQVPAIIAVIGLTFLVIGLGASLWRPARRTWLAV